MTTTEFGSLGEPIEQTQIRVRKAARCLPRYGLGHAYGHVSARLDDAAAGVAETLGDARAIVLRGNGVVVTGATIEETAAMVFYLEQGAKTELAVLACGGHSDADPVILTPEQAEARNTGAGRIFERMWDYLTDGDPE